MNDQVNALADAAIKTHGRLDIWANVAGVIRYMNIVDATPEDVEFITKVNLWGTYWGVAAAGRAMTNGGSIINVSSAGGDMPAPTLSIYAMTKAEEVMGKALKGRRRESLEIFTKVYFPTGAGVNDRGLSRKHIMESCESSLRRLQTDYVDLYQAHRYDFETPLEETLRAFDDLVRQGL